MADPFEV